MFGSSLIFSLLPIVLFGRIGKSSKLMSMRTIERRTLMTNSRNLRKPIRIRVTISTRHYKSEPAITKTGLSSATITLILKSAYEVLPGDTFNLRLTALGRMTTPIYPIMDNVRFFTHFFFTPNRLVWKNWA
jgi:hypothetical protein